MKGDVCIKRNSYCPICKGVVLADCRHDSSQFSGGVERDESAQLREKLRQAKKERDIVVGVLTQVRCYIDSPRFDEEGEVIEMVDDILKRMP